VRRRAAHGRLFWRVYLHGLLLLVIVAIALFAVGAAMGRGFGPPHRGAPGRLAGWAAARLSDARGDPQRLRAELERAREAIGIEASVWEGGVLLATNVEPPLGPLRPGQLARVDDGPIRLPGHPHAFAAPLRGEPLAYLVVSAGPPSFPWERLAATIGAVLVALALASVPLARAIASPVEKLTRAVQAFGAGDLGARARVGGPGEVGQLSRAFDDMADRIERLLRAERELLANVSHELRTPLARIRVALEIAAEGDAERARSKLGEVGQDLAEVERIVEDVLTAARLDAGGAAFALRRERVDAAEIVARAADRFRAAHPGRALEADADGALPALDADPPLLRRALDNLLDNAAKYSDAAAPVTLRAELDGGRVRLVVRDRGIGIAPDDLPRLFTPFFRTERSRSRAAGGTGLGLVLAQRIVEAHGGTIAVASAPGEGTTVTVALPAAGGGAAAA
jgi:signal transduction histidine kinase